MNFNHKSAEQLQAMTKTAILEYWEVLAEQLKNCYLIDKEGNFAAYVHVQGTVKSHKKDLMIERTLKAQETIAKHYKAPKIETATETEVMTEEIDSTTFADFPYTEMVDELYTTEVYTTLTPEFVKAELKEYRALGYEVRVKLNQRFEKLLAEYDRLECEINGVRCCRLAEDVLGGTDADGFGYGWTGESCLVPAIVDSPERDDNADISTETSSADIPQKSIAHSFMQMYRAISAKKALKPALGFGRIARAA